MPRALAILLTGALATCAVGLLLAFASVIDLPLCSDPGSSDECIEGPAIERALGLACLLAAILFAAVGSWLGVRFARRGADGTKLLLAVIATPLLAFIALMLLPVSF